MELKDVINKVIDDVLEKVEYGDLDYNGYNDYSVNLWLEKSEREKILEDFRINLIRMVDEQINRNPQVVVVLKKETTEKETLVIAENLQNYLELKEHDKLLEVIYNE